MKGFRYGSAFLLAAVWAVSLQAQEPGGTVRGRVTDEASQLPIRGATVTLSGRTAETRADGGYELTDLPTGTDTVRVTMIGYAPSAQAVTPAAGQTIDLDVALTAQAVNGSRSIADADCRHPERH
jgi:PEGA domain.